MKALAIVVLIAIVLAGAGYLTFTHDARKASVTIETEKLKEDAERVIEKTKAVSEDVRQPASRLPHSSPSNDVRHEDSPATP